MILADFAVKSAIVLTLAFVVVGLMRRASAASRHAVWTAAFAAIVLLPLATVALPSLPLRVLPADQPAPSVIAPPAIPSTTARVEAPPLTAPRATVASSPSAPVIEPARARSIDPWTPGRSVTLIWLLGFIVMLARSAAGTLAVRRLAHRTRCADSPRLLSQIEAVATSLEVRRPIVTLIAGADAMPATWGAIRPTLLLPSSAEDWPEVRLNAVLVHELAHVARWDSLSQAVARLAVALFWFNPLVWAAAGRARLERERACDDRVIASGTRASEYAQQLLALMSLVRPAGASTSLAMARRSHLAGRLSAILDVGVNRSGRSGAALALAAGFIVVTMPLAAARPAARLTGQSVPPGSGDIRSHVDLALPAIATDQQATGVKPAPVAAPSQAPAPQHLDFSGTSKAWIGSGEMGYSLVIRTPDGKPYVAPGLYDGHGKQFYFFNSGPAPAPRLRIDGPARTSLTFLHPTPPASIEREVSSASITTPVAPAAAAPQSSSSIAGTWTIPYRNGDSSTLVLVLDGTKITGTMSRPGRVDPLTGSYIDGRLTFDLVYDPPTGFPGAVGLAAHYYGSLQSGQLAGTYRTDELLGEGAVVPMHHTGPWTAERARAALPGQQSTEAPEVDVIVSGEVQAPGHARTKRQLALSGAIAQVGGYTPGAEVVEIRRRSSGEGPVAPTTPANEYRIQYVIRAELESHRETDPLLTGGEFIMVRPGLYLLDPPVRGFGAGAFRPRFAVWGLAAPVVLTSREPEYTRAGMVAKLQGTVELEVVVNADGTVREARVVKGLDEQLPAILADLRRFQDAHAAAVLEIIGKGPLGLDANAVECIKTWTFTPGTVLGRPQPMIHTVSVEFRLR